MGSKDSLSALVSNALTLAQIGEHASASSLASQARLEWRTEDSLSVTFDLMMVDGICSNYTGDLSQAFDRLNRASVLASMLGDDHRIHLSKAWLATVSFNLGRLTEAECFLSVAARHIRDAGPNALFRSATGISVLLQICGDDLAARQWIKYAQRAASAFGHPGLMSHLLYNISAARVSVRSLSRFFGESLNANAKLDSLAVYSSINFDSMSGTCVQPAFHPLIQAQALGIEGDYSSALAKLEIFLAACQSVPSEFVIQARFELLYAKYRLGMSISVDELRALEAAVSSLNSDDDLASAYYILHLCFKECLIGKRSEECFVLASEHKSLHADRCASIMIGLTRSGLNGVPEDWWNLVQAS